MSAQLDIALEHHQAGRLAQAEALYRRVLELEPANPQALHLLGVLAHQVGRNEEAIQLIEEAHRHGGTRPQSLNSLGIAYLASGRPREAKRCLTKALAMKADYADAHSNLGAAQKELGDLKEAERSYRRAVALMPESPQLHYNLGNLLAAVGRLKDAEQSYLRAIEYSPTYAQAYNNLGHVLWRQGRFQEALPRCRNAVTLDPHYAEAHHNLGRVLEDLAQAEAAEASYRAALDLEPDQIESRLNLGNLLHASGRYREAQDCFSAIVCAQPSLAIAHYNLANVLARVDRHQEALEEYRKVIDLDPGFSSARWTLAMSQVPAVSTSVEEALRCRKMFAAELAQLGEWLSTQKRIEPEAIAQYPFHVAYMEEPNRELLMRYGALCTRVMQPHFRTAASVGASTGRIRIGIVSAHVRRHSVWDALVRGWVHRLDAERFELALFHLGAQRDEETQWAQSSVARFEQGPRSLAAWVDAIRAYRPEVLLYPEIAMDMTTVRLASLRLAPIQATAWGHPETSGLDTMDYYLSGELFEPEGAEQHYSERLVRLPRVGCWYEERPVHPSPPDLASYGVERGSALFVCPGTPFKYAPQYDALLPAIARGVPGARFLFFTYRIPQLSEKLRLRLEQAFQCEGLSFEKHVRFLPWLSAAQFHGLMKEASVYLDTIGFSGFNTALQAIECNLPIVTREGRFMRGRLASGILKRIGMPELIAASESGYVALAQKLALDVSYRQTLSQRLTQERRALYGDVATIQALEQFLMRVARR